MLKKLAILTALAASGVVAACQPGDYGVDPRPPAGDYQQMQITGQAAYRERIMLDPGSTFDVTLIDISRSDSNAPVLAEYSRRIRGEQVPLQFTLEVPRYKLERNGRYAVRATITGPDRRLAWTTDTVYPVYSNRINQDLGTLQLVSARGPQGSMQSPAGRNLIVEDISGRGIIDSSNITINFGNDGRINGSDGCNLYSADYRIDERGMQIGAIAGTKRACAPALMNQGNSFMRVLQDVNSWTMDRNGRLTLKTRNGRYLVTTISR